MDLPQNNWKKALLSLSSTIEDAIKNLNASSLRIVLVVDKRNKLQGTISDGDIRSGLLRGLDLKSSIKEVINRDSITAPAEIDRNLILQLMTINKVHQIPVVNNDQIVQGLFVWDEITTPNEQNNTFVIMAGGLGTRLRPYTEECPKPLIEIAGKPMLQHIIERAKSEGFYNFCITLNYLGEMIEDYFNDGSEYGVSINYLKETIPLGTAGALSLMPSVPNEPIIVTNGDVMTDIKYSDMLNFHKKQQAFATMAVRSHEWQHPYGVVQTNGIDIIGFEEKPIARSHINAGVYVLSPEAIKSMKYNHHCDMPDLFKDLWKNSNSTVAYPMHELWLDVGRPDDLEKANSEIIINSSKK